MSEATVTDRGPGARMLLVLSIPAVIVGVVSALVLFGLESVAGLIEDGIWTDLPKAIGVDPSSGWWIFAVLSLTGVAVGLAVWLVPGHGGRDSATTELIAPPLRLAVLPSLILVTILALAGGVSLGPENPIIAINTGVLVALVAKLWPRIPAQLTVMVTAAGTIGALFGTPVAAALVFTGVVAALPSGGALWDRLFLPLVSAAAGALTMSLLSHPIFALTLPAYTTIHPIDLLSAVVIALVATLAGLVGVLVFPFVHRTFHRIGNPLIYITLGGIVLGLLGALGGPVTLFKGLSQMSTLVAHRGDYSSWQLAGIVGIKLAALVVAAASGFRGGRIFPAVFLGTAVGVLANAVVPTIPLALAIACGVLGFVLAIAKDGWIAIFLGVAVSESVTVLPILCVVILPVWLVMTRAPSMIVPAPDAAGAAAGVAPPGAVAPGAAASAAAAAGSAAASGGAGAAAATVPGATTEPGAASAASPDASPAEPPATGPRD